MKKNENISGFKIYSIAIVFSILVGFSFLGVKVCIRYADAVEILVHRYNIAFFTMLLLAAIGIIKPKFKGKSRKNMIITAGGYIAFMGLQTLGLMYASSIVGSIMFAIIPIIAKIIAGVLLNEKSSMSENIFVTMSVAALIYMIVMGSGVMSFNVFGITLLALSSIIMALSNVYMRFVRNEYSPSEICFIITLAGFAVFNFIYLILPIIKVRHQLFDMPEPAHIIVFNAICERYSNYFAPLTNLDFVIACSYLGIACIILSSIMIAYMLRYLPAVKATIFGNISTMISILAGVFILGEKIEAYHIICAILIITGVIGLSVSGNMKRK